MYSYLAMANQQIMTEPQRGLPTEVWSAIISGVFTVAAVGLTVYLTSQSQTRREEELWKIKQEDEALERERVLYERALGLCNEVLKRVSEILMGCPAYPSNDLGGKDIPEAIQIRIVDPLLDLNHIGFVLNDDIVRDSLSSLVDSAWTAIYAVKEKPNEQLGGHSDELQQRASFLAYQLGKLIKDPKAVLEATDRPEYSQANPRDPQLV